MVIRRTEAGRAATSRGRSRSRSGSGGRDGGRGGGRDGGGERDAERGEKPPSARQEQKRLRNERQRSGACLICGEQGHTKASCPDRSTRDGDGDGDGDGGDDDDDAADGQPTESKREARKRQRMEGTECRLCKQTGHFARACPDKGERDLTGVFCFICGGTGHLRVNCPERVGRGTSRPPRYPPHLKPYSRCPS